MRIGILTDLHLGYSHGTKALPDGTNVRESDVYGAAYRGVRNLLNKNVDAICDLGDIAHVPHPKKRAIIHLTHLINSAGVDWYSAGGNHTAQRTNSDSHLYDLIVDQCPRFYGAFNSPAYFEEIGAYLVPYDTSENIERALAEMPSEALWVGGHWACEDADWPGEHVALGAIPDDRPTLLGHWHKRYRGIGPTYIGATERFAWGEAYNHCGVAILDTDNYDLEFVDHDVRRWVDISVTPDDYLEDTHYENIEDCIVRVNVVASPEQYHSINLLQIRKKLAASLEYQIRRHGYETVKSEETFSTGSLSIIDGYKRRIASAKLPKGTNRNEIERIGLQAISE